MKRHLTILALILTVLLATTLVRAEAAPTFSVGSAEVPLNGEVTIDITIADMPAAGLNTFGCTVTFEPSKVEVTEVTAGNWYNPEGNMLFLDNIDNEGGTVTFGGGMATGGVVSGTLATLTFKGKSITASSAVTLEVFEAKDSNWADITATVSSGSIEVYQQHTLTVLASEGNGTISPEAGTYPYKDGTKAELTATPGTGWRFEKWNIDDITAGEPGSTEPVVYEITMNADKRVQAVFYQSEVKTIEVSGDEEITIPGLGETAVEKTYIATLKDQYGIEMTGAVTWSVEGDPAGVTIDQSGVLKVTDGAKDVTAVTIKAIYGDGEGAVTDTLDVSLARATPIFTTIEIAGDSTVIIPVEEETTTAEYTAIGKDQYGADMTVTFAWSLVGSVTGVSIDTTGKVTVEPTAVDGSSFTIQATSGEVTGSKEVTLKRADSVVTKIEVEGEGTVIIPVPGAAAITEGYTATAKDQYSIVMPDVTFAWSVSGENTDGVTIENGVLTVTGEAVVGKVTVKATYGEGESAIEGSKEITLKRADSVVTKIEVRGEGTVIIPVPEAAAITEGYIATAKDQYGIVMSDVAFTWSVSGEDTIGVTIENGALTVTDEAVVGTVTVKATYGTGEDAVEGSKEVTLKRADSILTLIVIGGPDSVIIPVDGETTIAEYIATGKDQYGADITVAFEWSLAASVTGVAINTETGEVTVDDTAQPGSFTIQVASGGVTASKTVTVALATSAPSSIEVSGTETIVIIDKAQTVYTQYNAEVFNQYGNKMVAEAVTWSVNVDDITGISIDVNGRVTIDGSKVTDGQTFIVTATSTSVGDVTGQLTVALQVPVDTSTTVTSGQGLTEVAGPGGSRLVIPAGAVTGETPVTISMTAITENPSQRPAGYGFIGGAGSLFTFGPEGYTFEQPLTIILSYADVDPEPDPYDLVIVRWSGESIEILGGTVDTVAKTISVTVTGFSDYGIMENVGVGSVVVSGADSIAIPRSDELNVTSGYGATVKDVSDNIMEGQEVTWSLATPVNGVSIDSSTGIVTITPAATTGNITVVATSAVLPDVIGEKVVEIYNEYVLTVGVDGGGTVTPSEIAERYKDGATQSLTATASSGWIFEKWVVGEDEYLTASIDVVMNADKTATAYFLRSRAITIVQDIPVPGGASEPEGEVTILGGGDPDPIITLVPEQVGIPGWSKTFHISVDDSTINNISGELTFDSAKVSIGIDDIIAKYGTIEGVTCTEDEGSGTKTIRFSLVNISGSGFTGGELITVRAAALDYTDTETGGATVTSTLGLTIDNWCAESVSGATVENYLLGDVDKRYGIKPSDAMETLRFALGLYRFGDVDPILADINNDFKVTTADALNILRISVGLAPQTKTQ